MPGKPETTNPNEIMDYIKPFEVVKTMLASGDNKAGLPVKDLLIRGTLSGALLGFATSLAITATAQTNIPLVGALVFPVGFVMIVLLGLELVTGSFAVVMLAGVDGRHNWPRVFANLFWVFVGNLIGSLIYGVLLYAVLTSSGSEAPSGIASKIVAIAEAKNHGLRGAWHGGHDHGDGQGHSLQLDGLPRLGHGDDVAVHRRQNRRHVAADSHVLRPGV